jgi:hypothetical protein
LAEFVAEAVTIMRSDPTAIEIVVDRRKPLRFTTASGMFDTAFKRLNEAMGLQSSVFGPIDRRRDAPLGHSVKNQPS